MIARPSKSASAKQQRGRSLTPRINTVTKQNWWHGAGIRDDTSEGEEIIFVPQQFRHSDWVMIRHKKTKAAADTSLQPLLFAFPIES